MKMKTAFLPDPRPILLAFLLAALVLGLPGLAISQESVADTYVMDFLAPASTLVDMNPRGLVIGEKTLDEGCDPFCTTWTDEVGVWGLNGRFRALPMQPAWSWAILEGISADGWIAGTAYSSGDIRGVVWKPNGSGYDVLEIANLVDCNFSTATGIDDSNRVVGFCNRQSPAVHKAFVWTESGGPVALAESGFPSSTPLAISPGGTVAYLYGWYQLDVPGVVHENTSPPDGFRGPGAYVTINDAGDQLRLIGPTSGQNINYPFRYNNTGEWQQLWPFGGIDASPFGVGSITDNLDITLTIGASGLVAPGIAEPADSLTDRLAPSYGDATVYEAGPISEDGDIVARVTIGRAPRLVRLVEAEPCVHNCIRVSNLRLKARFVDDPDDPGRCVGNARTEASAHVRVTDENGTPLQGVGVTGHFLTVYRLDDVRTRTTNANGDIRFKYSGAPCTGAMTFVVSRAAKLGYTFDRTEGKLQDWMLPQ